MNVIVLLFALAVGCAGTRLGQTPRSGLGHASDATLLLKQLSKHLLQDIEAKLRHLAEESPEGRTTVIGDLINVVGDQAARAEWPVANRWILAVDLLGYLRATEATSVLIENLDHTGENGIMSSAHYQPVARALANIGKPAVPGLIQALGSDNEEIKFQARQALASIGNPAAPSLLAALSADQTAIKSGAAMVLALIGGPDARDAIERAIRHEKNQKTRDELQEALAEFDRRWTDRR